MGRFVLRRLLQAIPTFLGITLLAFVLMYAAPGDPVRLMVFGIPDMQPEDVERIRRNLGLDQPIHIQYLVWLKRMVTLDFGQSFLYKRPVIDLFKIFIPNTLQLAFLALITALAIGVPLGVVAARFRGSIADQAIRVFGVLGHALPAFWFGLIFILFFGVQLRWFPITGMLTIGKSEWDIPDRVWHLVGPVLTLSLTGIANYSRYMRTETLDIINQDFIRTARSKGLKERTVMYVHALRNALLPLITALGGLLAVLISGSVIVESVFSWPGVGRLTFQSALSKDYPVVMAAVVLSSALLLFSYILRDIAYSAADPRVRHS